MSKFLLLLLRVVVSLLSSGVVETESVKYCVGVGVVEMTAARIVTVDCDCSFHVVVCDKRTGGLGRHQLHKALEGSSYVHMEQSYYCWNC